MDDPRTVVVRFQATMELFEVGVSMMRQNLRRAHPDAGEREIEALLVAWLHDRPGAKYGDAEGRPAGFATRLAIRHQA